MTDIAESEATEKQNASKKSLLSYWWALLGTIVLGAVGSGVWDILAKPGLSSLGRLFLNIISLGSIKARDYVYENAALDPYPLPAVTITAFLAGGLIIIVFFGFTAFKMKIMNALAIQGNSSEADAKIPDKSENKEIFLPIGVRRRVIMLLILVLGCIIAQIYIILATTLAISVRRFFEANVQICNPVLSLQEERKIRAQFASIKTKSDYEALDTSFRSLCEGRGVHLRDLSLW
jgi:hypothetical protein